jgi:hypothetical protein
MSKSGAIGGGGGSGFQKDFPSEYSSAALIKHHHILSLLSIYGYNLF